MTESRSHYRAKRKAAGRYGKTEARLKGGRRLDALSRGGKRATEVERSGSSGRLEQAARRLRVSGARQKVLQVPQKDMPAAIRAMRKTGTSGTVKNMGGTKRQRVRRPSKRW